MGAYGVEGWVDLDGVKIVKLSVTCFWCLSTSLICVSFYYIEYFSF